MPEPRGRLAAVAPLPGARTTRRDRAPCSRAYLDAVRPKAVLIEAPERRRRRSSQALVDPETRPAGGDPRLSHRRRARRRRCGRSPPTRPSTWRRSGPSSTARSVDVHRHPRRQSARAHRGARSATTTPRIGRPRARGEDRASTVTRRTRRARDDGARRGARRRRAIPFERPPGLRQGARASARSRSSGRPRSRRPDYDRGVVPRGAARATRTWCAATGIAVWCTARATRYMARSILERHGAGRRARIEIAVVVGAAHARRVRVRDDVDPALEARPAGAGAVRGDAHPLQLPAPRRAARLRSRQPRAAVLPARARGRLRLPARHAGGAGRVHRAPAPARLHGLARRHHRGVSGWR